MVPKNERWREAAFRVRFVLEHEPVRELVQTERVREQKCSQRKMKIFALIALGTSILSAFILRGSFGHTITVYAIGFYIGAPLLLFMVLWLLFGLMRTQLIPQGLNKQGPKEHRPLGGAIACAS